MKIAKELDYNLQAYQDRVGLVNYLDKEGILQKCSPGELDKVANYLLYAEDVEAEVELKEGSKKKVSYETLIESTLGENIIENHAKTSIYKASRPSIDRGKDSDIPNIKILWEAIDCIDNAYRYCKDVLDCKIPIDPERKIIPTYQNKYFFREWMIDLRREQFLLKDSYKPVIGTVTNFQGYSRPDDIIGMKIGNFVMCDNEVMIDFGNWQHVYNLLKFYSGMKGNIDGDINNNWWEPYEFLDYLIERVRWSPEQKHILIRKIDKIPNETIVDELRDIGGKYYSVNYISTIWKQQISKQIVKCAILYAKEKSYKIDGTLNNMVHWRVCPECEKTLFADTFNFNKKLDGSWKAICKDCAYKEKEDRENRRRERNDRKNNIFKK